MPKLGKCVVCGGDTGFSRPDAEGYGICDACREEVPAEIYNLAVPGESIVVLNGQRYTSENWQSHPAVWKRRMEVPVPKPSEDSVPFHGGATYETKEVLGDVGDSDFCMEMRYPLTWLIRPIVTDGSDVPEDLDDLEVDDQVCRDIRIDKNPMAFDLYVGEHHNPFSVKPSDSMFVVPVITYSAVFEFPDGSILELPAPEGWTTMGNRQWDWPHVHVTRTSSITGGLAIQVQPPDWWIEVRHDSALMLLHDYAQRLEVEKARILSWTCWVK